ncbi:hypothetical protein D3C81_1748290 [compost metagenome]
MGPVFEPAPRCEPRVDVLGGLIIAFGKPSNVYAVLATEIPDLTQVGDLDNLLALAFDHNLWPRQGQRKGALGRFHADYGRLPGCQALQNLFELGVEFIV